ncbi:HAAS signaling domain-containing protein [Priestia koreensis]|uniref:DUF1700 domain-containing protein n=1 Tax=Priestia koreensis TaxID=284581 RepID=A0A0M0KZP2_9BACI|nr:DUF1700 domain-containing protein [Priestia koreensis]KOO44286.1 hypothetical protein AMD01_13455 [Priestia koreensis]MCM3005173.1 DUF1700 domain-containing protein [Priestia koreensis]
MGKNEFLQKLRDLLRDLPEVERQEILYDYEEHFEVGMEEGKSEAEIIRDLGDPYVIAKDLVGEQFGGVSAPTRKPSTFKMTMIAFGLILFNLVFVVGPASGILGSYVGFAVTAVVVFLSPLLLIFSIVMFGLEGILFQIFVFTALFGLGILLLIATIYIGKFLYRVLKMYVQFNLKLVKQGGF